jgi:hypothetical protein
VRGCGGNVGQAIGGSGDGHQVADHSVIAARCAFFHALDASVCTAISIADRESRSRSSTNDISTVTSGGSMPATSSMISASLAKISFYADQTTSVLQIDAWKSFILLDACQELHQWAFQPATRTSGETLNNSGKGDHGRPRACGEPVLPRLRCLKAGLGLP